MNFVFEQTTNDILDFSKSTLKKNPFLRKLGIIFGCLIIFNLLLIFLRPGFQMDSFLSWIIPVALIFFLWILIFPVFLKRQIRNPANKQRLLGEWEIDLSENEIRVVTPVSETVYKWSAFTELGQSTKSYFLYIGKSQGIVLPKRAFQSDVEMREFEEFVDFRIN